MGSSNRRIVSVFGSSKAFTERDADYRQARRMGRLLAEAGFVVATGGYHGSMEAASRGAREGGGRVIGVTTSLFDRVRAGPNPYVDEEIKFPTLVQRLQHLVTLADAWVALPGGAGTLSEVALSWSLMQAGESARKPLILVGAMWRETFEQFCRNGYVEERFCGWLQCVGDVDQVLPLLRAALAGPADGRAGEGDPHGR